jgi:hypothetical protein
MFEEMLHPVREGCVARRQRSENRAAICNSSFADSSQTAARQSVSSGAHSIASQKENDVLDPDADYRLSEAHDPRQTLEKRRAAFCHFADSCADAARGNWDDSACRTCQFFMLSQEAWAGSDTA